jgi:hypothetical protein
MTYRNGASLNCFMENTRNPGGVNLDGLEQTRLDDYLSSSQSLHVTSLLISNIAPVVADSICKY